MTQVSALRGQSSLGSADGTERAEFRGLRTCHGVSLSPQFGMRCVPLGNNLCPSAILLARAAFARVGENLIMTPAIRDAFWHALAASPIMMVRLANAGSPAHPMTAQLDRDADGRIWFFMSRDNTLAAAGPAHADFAASGHHLFAALEGTLGEETDRAVFDKLFSSDVAAWFKGGADSADVLLMRFDIGNAEIWKTDTTIAGLLHRLTGTTAERGDHETGPIN